MANSKDGKQAPFLNPTQAPLQAPLQVPSSMRSPMHPSSWMHMPPWWHSPAYAQLDGQTSQLLSMPPWQTVSTPSGMMLPKASPACANTFSNRQTFQLASGFPSQSGSIPPMPSAHALAQPSSSQDQHTSPSTSAPSSARTLPIRVESLLNDSNEDGSSSEDDLYSDEEALARRKILRKELRDAEKEAVERKLHGDKEYIVDVIAGKENFEYVSEAPGEKFMREKVQKVLKRYRHKLKKIWEMEGESKVDAPCPAKKRVNRAQWKALIKYWEKPSTKEKARLMTLAQESVVNQSFYGRTGLDGRSHNFFVKTGKQPSLKEQCKIPPIKSIKKSINQELQKVNSDVDTLKDCVGELKVDVARILQILQQQKTPYSDNEISRDKEQVGNQSRSNEPVLSQPVSILLPTRERTLPTQDAQVPSSTSKRSKTPFVKDTIVELYVREDPKTPCALGKVVGGPGEVCHGKTIKTNEVSVAILEKWSSTPERVFLPFPDYHDDPVLVTLSDVNVMDENGQLLLWQVSHMRQHDAGHQKPFEMESQKRKPEIRLERRVLRRKAK